MSQVAADGIANRNPADANFRSRCERDRACGTKWKSPELSYANLALVSSTSRPNDREGDAKEVPEVEENIEISAANPPPSGRERIEAAFTPSQTTPDSLVKHTDIIGDTPESDHFVSVSRTLFEISKEESTVDANTGKHKACDSGTDRDRTKPQVADKDTRGIGEYQPRNPTDNVPLETVIETGDSRRDEPSANFCALTPYDDDTKDQPHIQATCDNGITLQSIVRAHRVEIVALQAQHNTAIEALKQENADSIAYWERKNEDDCEKLMAQNAQLQSRNTQLEQALAEHVEIFGVGLSRFNEEKQSLQNKVQTLEAERDARITSQTTSRKDDTEHAESLQKENQDLKRDREKYVKTILRLNENVQCGRLALEQEKKAAIQQRKTAEKEQKDLKIKLQSHTRSHEVEVLKLEDQHETYITKLRTEAYAERETSRRKNRKLKAALKDLETYLVKEEEDFEVAIESAETSHQNELEDLKEQQADELKWAKKDFDDELGKEKEALRTCRSLKRSSENKFAEAEKQNADLHQSYKHTRSENAQLWEALDIGEEEWQLERKRMYRARIEAQVDSYLREAENERLRGDYDVDPVRKSQWKKLVENKDAWNKRLQRQHAEDLEKIYRLQVTVRITNEGAKEQMEALAVQNVSYKKLVQDLMSNKQQCREMNGKMLGMVGGGSILRLDDGLGAVIERSIILEEDNTTLLANCDAALAKLWETQKLLTLARNNNSVLKANLQEKKAVCEDLQTQNNAQTNDMEWLKSRLDVQLPKEHAAELDRKDRQIADLEGMIAKLERRLNGLVQLKANNGIQAVVDDKDMLIAELSTQREQLNQTNLDTRTRYQAVAEIAAWQEECLDIAKESQDRDSLRAIVAEGELHRLRYEMANGNKKICDPTKWANWHSWQIACLNTQKKWEEANQSIKLATQKVNGLVKLVEFLWRRVIGFEWLISPNFCPPRLTETRTELVRLSKQWLGRDVNDSTAGNEAASLDDEEVENTGTYLGPRVPPTSWTLIDQRGGNPGFARHTCQLQYPNVTQQSRKEHTLRVIRNVLAQWTKTTEFLNVALSRVPVHKPFDTRYMTQRRLLDSSSVGQLKIYQGTGETDRPTHEKAETESRCSNESGPSENDFFQRAGHV